MLVILLFYRITSWTVSTRNYKRLIHIDPFRSYHKRAVFKTSHAYNLIMTWQGSNHKVWLPHWTFRRASKLLLLSLSFFNYDLFALEITIFRQIFVSLNQFIAARTCRLFLWINHSMFWPWFTLCKHYATIFIDVARSLVQIPFSITFLTLLFFFFLDLPSSRHKFYRPHYKIQNHFFARNIVKCAFYDLLRTIFVVDCVVLFGQRFWFMWV